MVMAMMTTPRLALRERHQRDGQQDARDGHEPVHDPHDRPVGEAEVARHHADQQAEHRARSRDAEARSGARRAAMDGAAPEVAAIGVGAEVVLRVGRLQAVDDVHLEGVVRRDPGRADRAITSAQQDEPAQARQR
jgi:hypothetical protein